MKLKNYFLMFLMFLGVTLNINATIWYVDSNATGANNGSSWSNAWKTLTSISGVKGGDIIYISGGPSGNSQTYSLGGSWNPIGGSSSTGVVTYQIGQDSLHNGTAIFNSSATFLGAINYVAIVGDAGDGQMHFQVKGDTTLIWNNSSTTTHLRVAYCNFGQVGSNGANPENWIELYPSIAFEFDHNYIQLTSVTCNAFAYFQFKDTTWDGSKIHDNVIYTPHASGDPGQGADGIESGSSSGYDIYNNYFISYGNAYTGGQHADGWQDTGGTTQVKIYNNVYLNYGNFAIYGDPTFGPLSYVYCFNNLVMDSDPNAQAGSSGGIIFGTDGGLNTGSTSFANCIIVNNVAIDYLSRQAAFALNNHTSFPTTFNNCVMANNVAVNSTAVNNGYDMNGNSSTPLIDCLSITSTQATSYFKKYVFNGGTNNDFHLTAAAVSLIGKGTNLSSLFTIDKDGNGRPSSGGWDIGAYIYNASSFPETLTIVSSTNYITSNTPNGVVVNFNTILSENGTNNITWTWQHMLNGNTNVVYVTGTGTNSIIQVTYPANFVGNDILTMIASNGVYSTNISLGYAVLSVTNGYNLIANPFNVDGINTIGAVLNANMPPNNDGAEILKFHNSGFSTDSYAASLNDSLGFIGWYDVNSGKPSTNTISPGLGFFYYNPSSSNALLTFLGNVIKGTNNLIINSGGYGIYSLISPSTLTVDSLPSQEGDQLLIYNNGNYNGYTYAANTTDVGFIGWYDGNSGSQVHIPISVGEGVFFWSASTTNRVWKQSSNIP